MNRVNKNNIEQNRGIYLRKYPCIKPKLWPLQKPKYTEDKIEFFD